MSKIFFTATLLIIALVLTAWSSAVNAVNYDFNMTKALRAVKFAKIAYCPGSDIKNWNCGACPLHPNFQIYQVYQNASLDSQGYTGYDATNNQVVVAFRGSANLINWITDFTFNFVDFPYCSGCQVHKGFWEEWQSYEVPLTNDVRAMLAQYPGASIGVYGHSLGAAVAVHAVATFNRLKLASNIEEYSFGTPRDGNPAFSEWVALIAKTNYGKTQRVVNAKDPVPHLPLEIMGFLHTPHETWMKDGGVSPAINCNDYPGHEDPDCSDSVIIPDVEDHLHYLNYKIDTSACNMNPAASAESRQQNSVAGKSSRNQLNKKLYKMFRQNKALKVNKK